MILVADTSALLTILLGEPERLPFKRLLLQHEPEISAGTFDRNTPGRAARPPDPKRSPGVDTLLETSGAAIVAVDADQVAVARQAMLLFGKGRGDEPAVLNFGDLFAYALAKRLGVPLLYKGDDFARTDVRPVLG